MTTNSLSPYRQLTLDAIQLIEDNLKEDIDLESISKSLGISHWHFQRIFRSLVGCPMGQYIRSRRLSESLFELQDKPHLEIIDLALDFQFGSHEAFSRSFKNYFGLTPSDITKDNTELQKKIILPLTEKSLLTIWDSVLTYKKITLSDDLKIYGFSGIVPSPFGNNLEFENQSFMVWNNFLSQTRQLKLSQKRSSVGYGINIGHSLNQRAETMEYFVGKNEEEYLEVPENFILSTIPKGDFWEFSIEAPIHHVTLLVDYIYGPWMLGQNFQRDHIFDFEKIDFSLMKTNQKLSYTYYLSL